MKHPLPDTSWTVPPPIADADIIITLLDRSSVKPEISPLDAGLYLVATPIGNARDITLRALDILASADVIAAEDTRTARKLMDIHAIPVRGRPMIPYHDHSGQNGRDGIRKLIAEGRSVAYVSEAGTPLVADPGYALARDVAQDEGLVTAAPGASAVLTALSLSSLPSDRFLFAGFPPAAKGARKTWLSDLLITEATIVLYESPKRINRLLMDLCSLKAGHRPAAICRELTKRFEEVLRGNVQELSETLEDRTLKGEIVLVIGHVAAAPGEETLEQALRRAMKDMSKKDAVAFVTEALGLPRRKVYQAALELESEE
ncbi:16S rRNA (cytidine(1402)-2'-O)-methyltransferase [Aliiroseovarius crassostreae]|uniref:Ribosomal RNA small subunit methyltransferase I n=1 Tax=Aliiroseovarius crassostreae TaxID=154981 RepID=A0A9Q9HDG8_9RHOB|nr:16S rRNA (cytidine(1402)-2'-O)-methyltransferase [Aliiroseovarius crassostreae]UWP95831.1 16S rRNA (cytidine(1402)-2'-O)-methyltransferase [Aliiroseovarius crassostreae]UWP99002.1 16S rRNA (cytidine(1402)-2'-O)-methyltransferase [Aliiroseovarius crassostreae]